MKLIILMIAISLSILAAGKTMEVFLNIPGQKPVHCVDANIEWVNETRGYLRITMPWGVTYFTHISNVVLVERKGIVESLKNL